MKRILHFALLHFCKRFFCCPVTIELQSFFCYDPVPQPQSMQGEADDITGLLASWKRGDQSALDRLLPLIQGTLQRIARRHLARERKDHTVQPSSLVQETFMRLFRGRDIGWRDRAHFFATASLRDAPRTGGPRARA